MKTRLKSIVLWAFLLLKISTLTFAQKQKKWNIGISTGYGKDFFYKKFHVQKSMIPPGAITHFHSFGSLKSGISVERFLKPRLSIRAQAEYSVVEMPNYIVFEIWTLDYDEKNQRDHWGAFSVGVRKYFKSESPFKSLRIWVCRVTIFWVTADFLWVMNTNFIGEQRTILALYQVCTPD